MKKKIILSFVGIIVIVIGIFAAYFVVEANKDAAVIEDTDAKFTSDLIEISDNSTPEEHSASDVIAMALWKIANTDAFRTETTGTADASIATQLIAGERIVIGDNAMVRSISSGFVSVGSERFFYKDKVLLREPESIDGVNATFKTVEPECLTIDGYMQRYGWLPFQATGYIISKDTFLTEPTMVNNGDGTYILIMDLNPDGDYAPFWYRREVLTNSSSTIIPEFFKIHMEMTIDSTYRILSNDIQEEYQVKSMGVTATSKTKVHEVFYYDNISFPEDITNFYDQYKGMEASNGEETKKDPDNLSIITEALIGKTSNYQVNINLNGEDINGNVYLNLLDIDNVNVVAELLDGELYVEFTDALYLSYGNIKLKLDINELSSLIPASETEGEGSSSIDVAGIIADIQNGKVSKVDNLTVISTTLNIMGIKINVIFEVKVTEDAYTMQAISGIITLAGFDIKVSLKPTDKKVEKRDTNEFMNIMNSKDIISKIIDIVSNKKIDLSLNLEYQGIKASGVVTLDFNEGLKALANLNLKVNNETYNIKAIYQDKVIYLDFKNIHAKISVDTLTSLFDLGELKNNSNIKIVEMLSSDEIKNLINFEELGENIKVLISASSINSLIKKELLTEDIKININATDDKVNLSVNMLDLNISLSKSENVIDINPDNYVSLDNLVKNAFDIYNTLKDGGRININANIDLKELANIDLTVSINGYIDLFIDGKDIAISGILNLGLGNNNIEVKILFEDNTLTVELFNNTIRLTVDEIKNLINEITTRFNLTNNTFKLNINELLDGITLNDDGVCVDLSSILSKLGIVSVSLRDKVEVSSGLFNAEITFANLGEKVTFEGDVITYDDIISILDKVNVITSIVDDKIFDFALSFIYNSDIKASINGTLDLSGLENIKAKLNAKLSYKEYLFELDITFINNKLYVDFNNIHGALSLDTIKSLIPTSDIKFDLDINSAIDLVFKLVKEINIKDLKLTLAKDELNNLLNGFVGDLFKLDDDLVIDLDITDKVSVDINLFDIALTIAKTDANIEVNEDNYVRLDSLVLNVVDIVKDVMNGARINIDANINLKDLANIDLTIGLNGYVDLIKENDKFIISSILNVKVSNSTLTVKLLFEDNTLTIEVLNNRVRLTVDEIKELINEITTRFNLASTNTFELNINELLNGISLTDTGIKADLSSIVSKLGEVSLSVTDKVSLNGSFFNVVATLSDTEEKVSFSEDIIEYQDIISLLDKVSNAIDIIDDKKFDIDLSLDYKDLHVEAIGTIDLTEGIKADVKIKLADFEVGVKFINNAIYLDFANIHGKLKLETIKKLLPKGVNLNLNINVNEIIDLVFNLLDEINLKDLSISLKKNEVNKLLDKYLGFITLEDNLNIKLNITDKINLLVSLFNIDLTISKTNNEITVIEESYSELGYLTERIYDIYMRAKDGKRININAQVDLSKFTNIDLALSLDGYVDFFINDGKVTLSSILNLKVGSNGIEIKLLFNDDIITVELLNNVIKLSVDDIKDLLNEIATKFIKLGTNNNETTIDIVSLLKSIVLTEDSISVDLSSFATELGIITLKITDNDIKVINNGFSASVTLADTGKLVVIDDKDAIDKLYLDSLIDDISYILDILNEKKMGIDLSLDYKDISAKVSGLLDFSDKIKLDIDANVKYKDIVLNPNIKLIDDTLYISLNNINAKVSLDTIKGLIDNTNNTKLETSEIIDLVFDLLDEINLKDLSVSLKKDKLNELVNKYLSKLLKEDLFIDNLVAKVIFDEGINLTLNQFGFNAKVSKADKEVVLDTNTTYTEIDNLVNDVAKIVKDVLDDNGARLDLNANINLKDLANIDLSLGITGYLDIVKSSDKFTISSLLTIKVSETEIEVKALYKDDTLTISLLDNVISLSKDEIKDLITDIKTKFASDNSAENTLDIASIIDGLSLSGSGISADLSSILSKFGTLALSISKDEINITNDSINANITFAEVGNDVTLVGELLTYNDISALLDQVKTIVDIIKDKKLDLALSLKYKDIEANVSGLVDFSDKEDIKLDVQANIKYKENNFNATIKMIDKTLYLDLANIHGSVKLETVKGLLGDSETESSIDINEIIDLVFKSLDTIDLKNLEVVLTTTELNKFIKGLAGEVIKEDLLEGNLIINLDVTDKVEVTLNQFDLKASISSTEDEVVLDTNTTYTEIDSLVNDVVTIVKDVLDDNGARLNINANINLKDLANIDLSLGLTGYVDIVKADDKFTVSSVLTVKVSESEIEVKVLYKEDTLTISLLDNIITLTKDEIKNLITDIKTKFADENSSESTLDIESIIDGLTLTNTGVSADLSSLLSKLGTLALTITSDKITLANDSIDALITFGEVGSLVTIEGEALTYSDVSDLLDEVKTIVDIIKTKKLDLALSLKYKDIEANVSGLVDFSEKEDIKLSVTANIKYKENEFDANIKLIDKVLYLDIANIHGSVKLETIKGLISDTESTIDINEIIDLVFKSLDTIDLKNLKVILTPNELNKFIKDFAGFIIKEDLLEGDLVIDIDVTDKVTVIANQFDLSASIAASTDEVALTNNTYVEIDSLVDDVMAIVKDVLDDNGARLNINANINLKKLLNMDMDVKVTGYADILKDQNDKLTISAYINIEIKDYIAELYIAFENDMLYVKGFNNATLLSVDEIKTIIERIKTKYFADSNMNLNLESIINNVFITEDDIKLDLVSIHEILEGLVLEVNSTSISLTNSSITLGLSVAEIGNDKVEVGTYNIDYDRITNLLDNFDYIYDIIMNKESYEFTFSLEALDNYEANVSATGTINVVIDEDGTLRVKAKGLIKHKNIDHDVEIIYISNPKDEEGEYQFLSGNIYFIYGNNCGNTDKLRFSSSVDNILLIINEVAKLLGAEDVDMLNDPKSILGILDKLDLGTGTNDNKLIISNLLSELTFTDDSIDMKLSNKILFYYATRLMGISITAKPGELSGSLTGLYTKYLDEANNTMLNINSFKLTNNMISITKPSQTGYEISDANKLVSGLVNLINTNNIGITGTVSIKLPILSSIDVPVEVLVEIYKDENDKMKFRGYILLDMSSLGLAANIAGLKNKVVKLYYDDDMVYIYRKDSSGSLYQLKLAKETFLEDIVYYLLDYAMGMPDLVMSNINTETTDENKPIDATKAWTKYQYSNNTFNLGFDIGELVGNSDLGLLTLSLNLGNVSYNETETYMLKSITGINFELVGGIINIKSSALNIANISNNTYYEIDDDFISNYINSYKYDVDKKYKDGSYQSTIGHTVSFIYGLDLGGSSVNGIKGSMFTYPNIDTGIKEFEGNYYKFDGWYLDKGFTEEATETEIGEKSIKIYAKWLNITSTLTVNGIDGVHNITTYEGADLSSALTHQAGDLYYETSTDKSYQFKYYSLTENGEEYVYGLMPEDSLTLYEVWFEKVFYVRVNNVITEVKDYNFNETYYYVPKNDIYYGYNNLTKEYLLSEYSSSFILEEEKYIIDLKTSLDSTYKILSFNVSDSFNNKAYNKVASNNSNNFSYDMLPSGTYAYNGLTYIVDYWYNGSNDYYNDQSIRNITSSVTLYAYYSLSDEYFTVNNSGKVTGFSASGSNIMLIFPKYYGNTNIIIRTVGDSAFESNTQISSAYLNEGMTTLETDAFKNAKNLRNIYFSDTVTSVASDAFYYDSESSFEKNRDIAKNLRFIRSNSSTLSTSKWLATKWNTTASYYGDKNGGFLGMNEYDYSNAFKQRYSGTFEALVHNLF